MNAKVRSSVVVVAWVLACAVPAGAAVAPAGGARDAGARGAHARGAHASRDAREGREAPASPGGGEVRITQGRFGEVVVHRPPGRPTSAALFVSDADGWTPATDALARQLAARGAVAIGIDFRRYRAVVDAGGPQCQYVAGEFEYLSHYVQKKLALDEYHVPVFVGRGAGAALAYAVAAESPKGTYAGALGLGFRPELELAGPLCRADALKYDTIRRNGRITALRLHTSPAMPTPWITLDDGAPQFADAFVRLAVPVKSATDAPPAGAAAAPAGGTSMASSAGVAAAPLADLPLVEVPATARPDPAFADTFAVLLTGDGGWAGIDQDVSAALVARGIPVVALNSLKYFWKERQPPEAARDLDRIVTRYAGAWRRERVLLVGYSFGADVLPFLYPRLPAATRARVRSVSLLGLGPAADFEFHVADWLPGSGGTHATVPEVRKFDVPTLCVLGAGENDSVCPQLSGPRVTTAVVGEGHHFGGDAAALVQRILDTSRAPQAPPVPPTAPSPRAADPGVPPAGTPRPER